MAPSVHNLLLMSLSKEASFGLSRHFEHVELPLRTVLYESDESPRYIHFLTSGIASTVVPMKSGEAVEVGVTGHEGFAENTHILGKLKGSSRCFMQVKGSAWRMNYQKFMADLPQHPELMQAMYLYTQHNALVLAQLSACNRLHEVEVRMARWLLMVQDRVGESELRLTQEFLGEMLGTRRSSVNLAAGSLQRAQIISYSRGKICILSREALESAACECYPVIAKLFRDLYAGVS